MFEHLSKRAERVIAEANNIAREYGIDYVGTEHLLLAIARDGDGLGARILRAMNVDEYKLQTVVEQLVKKSMEDTWVFGRLPGTPHYRNVMAMAIEEARQLESKQICTEHLLLGLLREKGSVAEVALGELGVTAGKVRAALTHVLEQAAKPSRPGSSGEFPAS
ncbi:MAG: hypothetical protein L6Q92_05480 [Phycisphaerae bacterium]|nr:hypothetical protein [Phycisphaerae bacterium]